MTSALLAALSLALAAHAGQAQPKSFDQLWAESGAQISTVELPKVRPKVAATIAPPGQGAGQGIVFVGDSHSVGPFGERMYQGLQPLGPVTQFSVCGASINWWLDGKGANRCGYEFRGPGQGEERQAWKRSGTARSPDRHEQLAAAIKAGPRAVIIALGANKNGDLVRPGARLMAMIPAQTRCFWVSPPPVPHDGSCSDYDRGDFSPIFQAIRQAAGRDCTLIDSSKYVNARDSSGCHFDNPSGARWGQGAAADIVAGFSRRRGSSADYP